MEVRPWVRTPEGKIYRPNELQLKLHNSTSPYSWMHSGIGSGKTLAANVELLRWGFANPGSQFLITRNNMTLLRENTWKVFLDIVMNSFPHLIVGEPIENQTLCRLVLDVGSDEEGKPQYAEYIGRPLVDVDALYGLNLSGFLVDEACVVDDERLVLELDNRTRRLVGPNRGIFIGIPNGHDFMWKMFVQNNDPDFYEFGGSTYANNFLERKWIERKLRVWEKMGLHDEIRRQIYGEFVVGQGLIFKNFKRSYHVISPRYLPADFPNWKRYRAIDPGGGRDSPAVCIFAAVDTLGRTWIYDLIYETEISLSHHASLIRQKSGKDKFEFTVIDKAAYTKERIAGPNMTIKRKYEEELGCSIIDGTRDVDSSLMAVRELLLDYKDTPHPADIKNQNAPRLYILDKDDTKPAVREFENWKYGPDGKPEKKNDHFLDALRYLVYAGLKPTPLIDTTYTNPLWKQFHKDVRRTESRRRAYDKYNSWLEHEPKKPAVILDGDY